METNSKILVTGANGLLGTNTIIGLLKQGFLVKGFLRDKRKYLGPKNSNLELVEGDINNLADLKSAIFGCEYIVNCAAITDQRIINYREYYQINVQSIIDITNIAIQLKVKKIIQVSTANVFGYGCLADLGNESKTIKYPFNKSLYAISKKAADDFLLTKKEEIEIIIVNPTFMIGGFDAKPSSGKIVHLGLKNRVVFCPPGGKNFVCVRDVARGIINALSYGIHGESYLIANKNLTYFDFFRILRNEVSNNFVIIKIPKWTLIVIGCLGSMLRFFKIQTSISIVNMQALCIKNYYSNAKAVNNLKLLFSPIENGVKEAVEWFGAEPSE